MTTDLIVHAELADRLGELLGALIRVLLVQLVLVLLEVAYVLKACHEPHIRIDWATSH